LVQRQAEFKRRTLRRMQKQQRRQQQQQQQEQEQAAAQATAQAAAQVTAQAAAQATAQATAQTQAMAVAPSTQRDNARDSAAAVAAGDAREGPATMRVGREIQVAEVVEQMLASVGAGNVTHVGMQPPTKEELKYFHELNGHFQSQAVEAAAEKLVEVEAEPTAEPEPEPESEAWASGNAAAADAAFTSFGWQCADDELLRIAPEEDTTVPGAAAGAAAALAHAAAKAAAAGGSTTGASGPSTTVATARRPLAALSAANLANKSHIIGATTSERSAQGGTAGCKGEPSKRKCPVPTAADEEVRPSRRNH
jgi:hypothetical protein